MEEMRWASIVLAAAIVISVPQLGQAAAGEAEQAEVRPRMHWASALCDELSATGLVAGYDAASFDVDEAGQMKGPFTDFVVALVDQTKDLDSGKEVLPDLPLWRAKRELLEAFGNSLEVVAVRPAQHRDARNLPDAMDLLKLDHILGGRETLADIKAIMQQPGLEDGVERLEDEYYYDTLERTQVERSHPIYRTVNQLYKTSMFFEWSSAKGAPAELIPSGKTWPITDFYKTMGHAVDALEEHKSARLRAAEEMQQAGVSAREFIEAYWACREGMRMMCACTDWFNWDMTY